MMQNTTVVTSMPMQTGVSLTIPATPRSTAMNVNTIRGLGFTQIVIGVLTFAFGISAIAGFQNDRLIETGGGIWGGLWILVTGIIGVAYASNPASSGLNGIHMAFCIISTVVALIDVIIFAVGLEFFEKCRSYGYYYDRSSSQYYTYGFCGGHRSAGIGVYASLVTLMATEFFVAFVAAVYCCHATGGCCGGPVFSGVIIQQQQPQNVVTSSTTSGYPTSTGVMALVSYRHPKQPVMMQQAGTHQQMGITNVAYSSQYPQQQQYPGQEFQKNVPRPQYQQ